MEATHRFVALVSGPVTDVPLDEAALLIAAHADPRPGIVDQGLRALDALADACTEPTFAGLRHLLFEQVGLRGNRARYDDPRNSMLHLVLARRVGIPITLSVITIEVGRRLGVPVEPIAMPGHFLVRDPRTGAYADPFDGGRLLDEAGCRARFHAVLGAQRPWSADLLAPARPRAVLARMLANLEAGPLGRDLGHLAWLARLHRAIPGLAPGERLGLARALALVGDAEGAADELDRVAATVAPRDARSLRREAHVLRSRRN
jgi:regulator of sirC expression with transglutaminase-like and TPR domain